MIRDEVFEEAERVLQRAEAAGLNLRATGGVAVGLRCPSAKREPLARSYNDIDFVAPRRQGRQVERLFEELGYEAEKQFNAVHGATRMFFVDKRNGREADVFIDSIRGCHELELARRLTAASRTLAPADLLLSKLQVRQTTRKDHLDIFALLIDCSLSDDDSEISRSRLTDVCCNDWGWWRTVTGVAASAERAAPEILAGTDQERVEKSLRAIRELLEDTPKSRRWKLRARVGERMQWYDEPEELAHANASPNGLGS